MGKQLSAILRHGTGKRVQGFENRFPDNGHIVMAF
jgi:hypothetical protein